MWHAEPAAAVSSNDSLVAHALRRSPRSSNAQNTSSIPGCKDVFHDAEAVPLLLIVRILYLELVACVLQAHRDKPIKGLDRSCRMGRVPFLFPPVAQYRLAQRRAWGQHHLVRRQDSRLWDRLVRLSSSKPTEERHDRRQMRRELQAFKKHGMDARRRKTSVPLSPGYFVVTRPATRGAGLNNNNPVIWTASTAACLIQPSL